MAIWSFGQLATVADSRSACSLARSWALSFLVGSRHNPVLRDLYQRLLAAGKAKKVALTACMRKLLTIRDAMAKSGQPRRPLTTAP